MTSLIHIYHNNKQLGPYSPEQIHRMVDAGVITPASFAWKEGMSAWAPLHTVLSFDRPMPVSASPVAFPMAQTSPRPSAAASAGTSVGPRGVGGWLLFFCITLTILGPLGSLVNIGMGWEQSKPGFQQFPNLEAALAMENIGAVAIVFYGFIVGCMIWSGNNKGREIAKKYLLIRLFGFIGLEFIVVGYIVLTSMGEVPAEAIGFGIGAAVGGSFREFIYFLIWWFYLKKSRRVQNTYGVN